MEYLINILSQALDLGASDIHLKRGVRPTVRVASTLMPLPEREPLTAEEMASFVDGLIDEKRREQYVERKQVDLAYGHHELGRFRVNIFTQQDEPAIAMRAIPTHIRNASDLHLPPVVENLAMENRGLILVTGTTGSGKSTTLAAMIDLINRTTADHIITIEDPIEYVHYDQQSIVSQREIGYDAITFADALKASLRQDPDIILVGEMRDLETIETALLAAETGHLVMSTLHTLDARETITRIVSQFPDHQREQIRLILASITRGILSQRLMPRADGQGMVPAVEVMLSTARIRDCIANKEKTVEILDAISQGHSTYGMQSFDQSLMGHLRNGLITYEEALGQASNPDDFALKVRGVASTSDRTFEDFEKDDAVVGGDEGDVLKIDRF